MARCKIIFVSLLMLLPIQVFGDRILRKDSTEIEGKIISEADDVVVIEVQKPGITSLVPVVRSAIAKIERGGPATKQTTRPTSQPSATPRPLLPQDDPAVVERRQRYLDQQKAEAGKVAERMQDARERREEAKRETERKRAEYMEKIQPQLDELDAKLSPLQADGKAAQDTLADLNKQYDEMTDDVWGEYRSAERAANGAGHPARIRAAIADRNARVRDEKLEKLRLQFQPQIASAKAKLNQLAREYERLIRKRKDLTDAAPKTVVN